MIILIINNLFFVDNHLNLEKAIRSSNRQRSDDNGTVTLRTNFFQAKKHIRLGLGTIVFRTKTRILQSW